MAASMDFIITVKFYNIAYIYKIIGRRYLAWPSDLSLTFLENYVLK
jgi:hypothetical protein